MMRALVYMISLLGWLGVLPQVNAINYAALGDSYASGDGAGSSRLLPRFDALCGRFSHAYPVQVANSTDIKVDSFRNLACGGAITTSVLNIQLPFIGDSQAITVQVGGNEIDFFVVVNECIYQWHPFSTCSAELERARGLVQSQAFLNNFNNLVLKTVQAANQNATVMILGYARFFNDRTDQCDHITFSHTNPTNYLTRSIRRQLNDIVSLLNDVVKASADAHGARYVDVDSLFKGHRFCEEGVIEPAVGTSWFFSDVRSRKSSHDMSLLRQATQHLLPNPFRDFLDFTRTFHPTSNGHQAIATEIVRILQSKL